MIMGEQDEPTESEIIQTEPGRFLIPKNGIGVQIVRFQFQGGN